MAARVQMELLKLEPKIPTWEAFVRGAGRRLPRDAEVRYRAMLARDPRIEIAPWPDKRTLGTWYRIVEGGRTGAERPAPGRGRLTKVEASRRLAAAHGNLPVFTYYGAVMYDPGPAPARGPTGFEVSCLQPERPAAVCAMPRSLTRARAIAQAHARAWGLGAEIWERTRRRRGDFVEWVGLPDLEAMSTAERRELAAELEQSLAALPTGTEDERTRAAQKRAWLRRVGGR